MSTHRFDCGLAFSLAVFCCRLSQVKVEAPSAPEGGHGAYELDPTTFQAHATPTEDLPQGKEAAPSVPTELADLGIDLGVKPAAKKPVHPHLVLLQAAIIAGEEEAALMFKFSRADGSNRSIYCEKVVSDWIRQNDSIVTSINLGEDTNLFFYHKDNMPVFNSR